MSKPFQKPGALALHNKLALFVDIAERDIESLNRLMSGQDMEVRRGFDLISPGERKEDGYVILDGWAARYKSLPDGRRQILSFLAPGDILGLFAAVSPYATTGVVCISNVTVAQFHPNAMIELLGGSPRLGAALAWVAAREQEILGEHLVSVGRRTARERVAHLFLELWARLRVRGLVSGQRIVVPLTQTVIADTLGLSVVHVNRTLKQLARDGLLEVDRERAVIHDLPGLQTLAGFDEDFLLHHYIPEALRMRLDRIETPSEAAQ
jgi:CRP-like cAMP-binding protein